MGEEEIMKDSLTCYYCGIRGNDVEARGMFYCPNLICTGPGAAWFRSKLDSFIENNNNTHSVCTKEWLKKAEKYLVDNPNSGNILVITNKFMGGK